MMHQIYLKGRSALQQSTVIFQNIVEASLYSTKMHTITVLCEAWDSILTCLYVVSEREQNCNQTKRVTVRPGDIMETWVQTCFHQAPHRNT